MITKTSLLLRQHGLALLELLIAMVIGSFLLLGMTQIMTSNANTSRVQVWQSDLQDKVRMISVMVSRQVRNVGFYKSALEDAETVFPAQGVFTNAGQTLAGTEGGAAADASDSLSIRFESDGFMADCQGNIIADGVVSANTWDVRQSVATGQYQLGCDNGVQWAALFDNVESLQIRYGIDSDDDDVMENYLLASEVTNWDAVRAVQMAYLLASGNRNGSSDAKGNILVTAKAEDYDLLGKVVRAPASGTDNLQRKIVLNVIALPNYVCTDWGNCG